MTDNEIIKALECCNGWDGRCLNCTLNREGTNCKEKLNSYALDLINRQRAELEELKEDYIPKLKWGLKRANEIGMSQDAEIERLKAENKILSKNADTAFQDGLNEAQDLYAAQIQDKIKSEAIKEFAERLKDDMRLDEECKYNCISCCYECKEFVPQIDNLVKEMTEVNENDKT